MSSVSSPESMMTVGTPARFASSTGRTSARRSSGASTMPWTPCERNPSITWICCSRSSSRSGPFQMMCTESPVALSSCAACTAPAWMLLQNSCVVPFGTTAMVSDLPAPDAAGLSDFAQAASANARRNARVFIGCSTSEIRGLMAVSRQHDSLDAIGGTVIAGKARRRGAEGATAVRDERSDVDAGRLEGLECELIRERTSVRVVASRCAHWRQERGLEELNLVQHAEIDTRMSIPVNKKRSLFTCEPGYQVNECTYTCCLV